MYFLRHYIDPYKTDNFPLIVSYIFIGIFIFIFIIRQIEKNNHKKKDRKRAWQKSLSQDYLRRNGWETVENKTLKNLDNLVFYKKYNVGIVYVYRETELNLKILYLDGKGEKLKQGIRLNAETEKNILFFLNN